jgi:hypothetical protein
VIQDYPLTLSVQMTPNVIRQIVQEHKFCVMLKPEDWPGLEKISALRKFQAEGSLRPISILTGNGGLFLDFDMGRGADGAMTGYAFPELLVDVVNVGTTQQDQGAITLYISSYGASLHHVALNEQDLADVTRYEEPCSVTRAYLQAISHGVRGIVLDDPAGRHLYT